MTLSVLDQFLASKTATPDAIEVYGAIAEAGNDIRCAAESTFYAQLLNDKVSRTAMADARRAAEKLIAFLDKFEAKS